MGHYPKPQPAPERPCGTPGAIWGTEIDPVSGRITLTIDVPGAILVRDQDALIADLHKALIPPMERRFAKEWDHFAGKPDEDGRLFPAEHAGLFERYDAYQRRYGR